MIDIQQLTSLISAFRVETEKESISPETVGSILQAIADLLATATSETEYNVLRFWKDTISQFQFLYDIQQRNVSDHSNVILALMGRRMASGETFSLTLPIGPATRNQAGVMTAEDLISLKNRICLFCIYCFLIWKLQAYEGDAGEHEEDADDL